MKTFIKILIAFLIMSQSVFSQTFPKTFNYQAVVRNNDGSPIVNKQITVEVSIVQGNACETNIGSCNLVWQELHFPTTNNFGLFSINIGEGQNTFAGSASSFSAIDWNDFSAGNYFLHLRVDFGNSSYANGLIDMGTVKLQAVPYATTAKLAENLVKNSGSVPIKVSELNDVDITSLAANQVLSWNGIKWVNVNPATSIVINFNDLSDVNINSPATNQAVIFNGTNWTNSYLQLKTLNDVSANSPATGDLLKFDGTNWTSGNISINNLSDASISGASANDILKFDGTNWVNSSLPIDNLSDVNIAGATNGQVIAFNGTNWTNQSPVWTNDGSNIYYKGSLNIGIDTMIPLDKFHLATSKSEGFLVTGDLSSSYSAKNLGAGTRMYFFPAYAAFRAGYVNGTQWDNSSLGKYSVAFGDNNTASGTYSSAFGYQNTVSGVGAFALGSTNTISGAYSIAGGSNNTVAGSNSIVFGSTNSVNADNSLTIGLGNTTNAFASIVIGQYCNSNSYNATGWTSSDPAFIIGNGTSASSKNNALVIYKNGDIKTEGVLAQKSTNPSKSASVINYTDILKLNAYSNNKNGRRYFGFSASEVKKYFPSLVVSLNKTRGIAYTQFIPLLVETVKTQQKTIDQLKTENIKMQKKLDEIEIRLQKLENK